MIEKRLVEKMPLTTTHLLVHNYTFSPNTATVSVLGTTYPHTDFLTHIKLLFLPREKVKTV